MSDTQSDSKYDSAQALRVTFYENVKLVPISFIFSKKSRVAQIPIWKADENDEMRNQLRWHFLP